MKLGIHLTIWEYCETALNSATGYWLFDDAEAMEIGSLFLPCFFPRLMHLSKNLVKKDQRNMEDTAAVNRPSEVEKEFACFFDNERMDAIEKMQSVYGSEEDNDIDISYPRLACMIFEVRKIEKIFIFVSREILLSIIKLIYPLMRYVIVMS